MSTVRVIGDVHGRKMAYTNIAGKATKSIQIGDLDFNYSWMDLFLDPTKHKFFGGNHDNYDSIQDSPHNLGDYGSLKQFNNGFFFRGAFSIDKAYRTEGIDWWEDEQLSYVKCCDAICSFTDAKCEVMLSHDCPLEITQHIYGSNRTIKTRTGQTLQSMFESWQPKIWIFGHHHFSIDMAYKGTRFICLAELEFIDLNEKGEF